MRQRFCKVCKGWHELQAWPSECYVIQAQERSEFPLPMIGVSDSTEPLRSMADGKVYTSRSAMRQSYKASNNPQGVNYVELGNEPRAKAAPKPKPDRAAIKEAVQRAESTLRTRGEWA